MPVLLCGEGGFRERRRVREAGHLLNLGALRALRRLKQSNLFLERQRHDQVRILGRLGVPQQLVQRQLVPLFF